MNTLLYPWLFYQVEPYVQLIPTHFNSSSDHDESVPVPDPAEVRYEGYIVDLLDRISAFLGLPYSLSPVEDGEYGQQTIESGWNGLVRRLIDRVARL